ncbi:MAG: CARDB domain-containing protein [Thermoguttaceae bacterium]|jgi:uncharacterized repeat protein (TIGR01451 family)
MKRILLRIAALGTVGGLGLIAIAQAQRGAQDRATTEPPPAAAVQSADPAGQQPPAAPYQPVPAAAEQSDHRGGEPRLLPSDVQARPLSAGEPAAPPSTPPPPIKLSNDDASPAATARGPVVDGNPLRNAPINPFAAGSGTGDNPVRLTADQTGGDGSNQASRSAAIADPAPSAYARRSQNSQLAMGDPPAAPLSHAASPLPNSGQLAAASGGDPAGRARVEPSDTQEPAPFKADPGAALANGSHGSPTPRAESSLTADEAPSLEMGAAAEGGGTPGGKQLEGPQSPQLTIQKFAPPEIQVGKPATIRVTVRNTGATSAANVEVRDQLPRGSRLMTTTPRAARGQHGELVWTLGTIKPGEESTVEIEIMPLTEGEIGSVATVRFDADASARSLVTRPKLVVTTAGANRILIGEETALVFTVSNPGSGVATGVVIEERVPAGLIHPAGNDLEYPIGDLKPGESRKLELKLLAQRPGVLSNILSARGEGNLRCEDRFALEVIAPQLDIALAGPKRRYLEREAAYQFSISNPGTAPAQQIELVAYLPNGLKFVSANNAGHYDETDRAIHWRLDELPIKEKGTVEMVTMPVEPGQQSIKLRATAQRGLTAEKEQPISIEGIASVLFQVVSDKNPVEVGGETNYEIHVANQGSKAATNLRVSVLSPAELKATGAEGPTRHSIAGGQVAFDPMASLAPKAEATYRVRLQGVRPGDLRVRCQLLTDEMQTPVVKEEGIRVYADE